MLSKLDELITLLRTTKLGENAPISKKAKGGAHRTLGGFAAVHAQALPTALCKQRRRDAPAQPPQLGHAMAERRGKRAIPKRPFGCMMASVLVARRALTTAGWSTLGQAGMCAHRAQCVGLRGLLRWRWRRQMERWRQLARQRCGRLDYDAP